MEHAGRAGCDSRYIGHLAIVARGRDFVKQQTKIWLNEKINCRVRTEWRMLPL
jgi:hypothetical protein